MMVLPGLLLIPVGEFSLHSRPVGVSIRKDSCKDADSTCSSSGHLGVNLVTTVSETMTTSQPTILVITVSIMSLPTVLLSAPMPITPFVGRPQLPPTLVLTSVSSITGLPLKSTFTTRLLTVFSTGRLSIRRLELQPPPCRTSQRLPTRV